MSHGPIDAALGLLKHTWCGSDVQQLRHGMPRCLPVVKEVDRPAASVSRIPSLRTAKGFDMIVKTAIVGVIVMVSLSACQEKPSKIVSVRFAEEDTITHVTFRAMIITGEGSKEIEAETPYQMEFIDESFVVSTYPQADSVDLFMESWGNDVRSSRVKGYSHAGTILYIKPNGGPGYSGSPE
ncbi:MAG: hypothetical protein F9K22_10315 [Bacteroidetes bacterium]|nr:MAG: hypothetical protein F9K22_10315 [Bacteroidota bacterium]